MTGYLKAMLYMEQLKKLEMLVQQKRTLRTDRITISKYLCNDYPNKYFSLALEGRTNSIEVKWLPYAQYGRIL